MRTSAERPCQKWNAGYLSTLWEPKTDRNAGDYARGFWRECAVSSVNTRGERYLRERLFYRRYKSSHLVTLIFRGQRRSILITAIGKRRKYISETAIFPSVSDYYGRLRALPA